jgi:hypothetical protein
LDGLKLPGQEEHPSLPPSVPAALYDLWFPQRASSYGKNRLQMMGGDNAITVVIVPEARSDVLCIVSDMPSGKTDGD